MKTYLTLTERKYLQHYLKPYIILPTKYKEPLVKNWNNWGKSCYLEKKGIEELLTLNQEYSLRTGKKISQYYYFVVVDLDDIWAKVRIKVSRYVETNKGIHRYLWIKELPKSCWLVNSNGEHIGELHSKGRFVVGIGSIHKNGKRYSLRGKNSLKWSLKFETLKEFQEFLKTRNILTTPWGKKGLENVRDLEPFEPKPKLSEAQKYFSKKERLEREVNQSQGLLNICYICLISYPKTMVSKHLRGERHQKNWKIYQARKATILSTK